jgi:hypothetical protein
LETIHAGICKEEAEPNDAFAALSCHCHGFYGELLKQASWTEYLYLRNDTGYDLLHSDITEMARAPGTESYGIHSTEDTSGLEIASMCACKSPVSLGILVGPKKFPTMNVRMRVWADAR